MLTPRENFLRFFRNEPIEWTPMDVDYRRFYPEELPDNRARGLIAQQAPFSYDRAGGLDLLGVTWTFEELMHGSIEAFPLLDDISEWEEKVHFPDLSTLDWEGIRQKNAEYLDTDLLLGGNVFSGFFERLISLLGFENAVVALIDEDQQEDVHRLFQRLADFHIEYMRYYHRYFGIERFCLHDDWGTQRGTIFSPETHAEMIRPYIQQVIDAVHAEGMFYEQHSCGKIGVLVPAMIEMGVDTWEGQDMNDLNHKDELIAQYGDTFKFGVGLAPLPTGDLDEAKPIIRKLMEKYAGKRVWLSTYAYTPDQRKFAYDTMRELCMKL